MATNSYFIDPSGGSDGTGDGSIGNPWASLAYAYANATQGTPGTIFNLKDSAADTLGATLSTPDLGTGGTKWCITRGYTSAAGDGGVGVIDGAGSYGVTLQNCGQLYGLEIRNSGAANLITAGFSDVDLTVRNCYLHNTSSGSAFSTSSVAFNCCFIGNRVEDIGGYGVDLSDAGHRVLHNYFKNGATNKFTVACRVADTDSLIGHNIISIDGTSDGIYLGVSSGSRRYQCHNNSVFSDAGSGTGILLSGTYQQGARIHDNIVVGFSDTGGIGFESTAGLTLYFASHNAAYDNATNYSWNDTEENAALDEDNEVLTAAPFAYSGADTFANRKTYFLPVDTGNILSGLGGTKGAVEYTNPSIQGQANLAAILGSRLAGRVE